MIDYKQLCGEVCTLAIATGDFLRYERERINNLAVETKGVHDYVTQFDKESERRIVARLRELLQGSGFIAEEGTASRSGQERYVWIIDPLDGTTNYIHGIRTTCISIALQENGVTVLGVVYEIWAQECFYAYRDGGAYLNGKEIHVSSVQQMNDALLATGFPYTDFSRLSQYMKYLQWTMKNTHGLRRFGSAAADLAYTACGRIDGFFEYGLKPYDVAAGAFLVEQAGGKVSDFSGGGNWLFGGEIVAAGAALYPEFSSSLASCMKNGGGLLSAWRKKN